MERKPLLQIMLDTEKNELCIGMANGLSEKEVGIITDLAELIGTRMIRELSKVEK